MADQEFEVPLWLDEHYLEKIIQSTPGRSDVEVCYFTADVATKKGQHYASELFRLMVKTSNDEKHHLILKKPHQSQENSSKVDEYDFFGKEIRFYSKQLPELYKILKSVDEYEELAPQLFHCDVEKQVVLMQDLAIAGYVAGNRNERISRDAALVYMRKLAKMHAASMILNEQQDGALAKVPFEFFCIEGRFQPFVKNHPYALIEEVKSWGEEFKTILHKLEKIAGKYPEYAHQATSSKGCFNVLLHADSWYTNVMIKKKGSKVEDVQMIDFQLTAWGSLATDLLSFIFRSLNEEDYQNELDYLLQVYYKHLFRVLEKHNFECIPSYNDIKQELRDHALHAYYSGLMCKAFSDTTDEKAVLEFVTDPEQLKRGFLHQFAHPRINKEIRFTLKWMDEMGAFDLE